jgi:RNA polymerase sigma factor (sigma-70 family)
MTMPSPVRVGGVCDRDLLGGFAIGDANAGTAFIQRFQGRVYGMAINLIGDRELAEDVSRKAFVRAWRRADTYDPECGSVAAWLLRITRNLAVDALRRRPQMLDPEMVAAVTLGSLAITTADATVASDLISHTRTALSRLPSSQSKAVCLAAFYGFTAREIAVSEGISVGTAKTRIREGLRTLRAELTRPDGV